MAWERSHRNRSVGVEKLFGNTARAGRRGQHIPPTMLTYRQGFLSDKHRRARMRGPCDDAAVPPPLVDVIALNAADARPAQDGGPDRIELVTYMARDGLTPDIVTFAAVRAAV